MFSSDMLSSKDMLMLTFVIVLLIYVGVIAPLLDAGLSWLWFDPQANVERWKKNHEAQWQDFSSHLCLVDEKHDEDYKVTSYNNYHDLSSYNIRCWKQIFEPRTTSKNYQVFYLDPHCDYVSHFELMGDKTSDPIHFEISLRDEFCASMDRDFQLSVDLTSDDERTISFRYPHDDIGNYLMPLRSVTGYCQLMVQIEYSPKTPPQSYAQKLVLHTFNHDHGAQARQYFQDMYDDDLLLWWNYKCNISQDVKKNI